MCLLMISSRVRSPLIGLMCFSFGIHLEDKKGILNIDQAFQEMGGKEFNWLRRQPNKPF